MSSNQFRICNPTNAGVDCTSSNPEPLCKETIANPASSVGFDPDNCFSASSTTVQAAIEDLCTEQDVCAFSATGPTTSISASTTLIPVGFAIEKRLGSAITITGTTGTTITLGETGTYFVSANLNYVATTVTTAGSLAFNVSQLNGTTGFVVDPCSDSRSNILVSGQGESVSTSTIACVSGVTGTTRNNELQLNIAPDGTLVLAAATFNNTSLTIRKISDGVCAPP